MITLLQTIAQMIKLGFVETEMRAMFFALLNDHCTLEQFFNGIGLETPHPGMASRFLEVLKRDKSFEAAMKVSDLRLR